MQGRKSAATGHTAASRAQRAGLLAGEMCLGDGINHVVRGGRVVKTTTTPHLNPNPSPQPVMDAPKQPKETDTKMSARPKKTEPKSTAAL